MGYRQRFENMEGREFGSGYGGYVTEFGRERAEKRTGQRVWWSR